MAASFVLAKNPEDMNWNELKGKVKVKFFEDEKRTYTLDGTDGKFFLVKERDNSVTKVNQIYVRL